MAIRTRRGWLNVCAGKQTFLRTRLAPRFIVGIRVGLVRTYGRKLRPSDGVLGEFFLRFVFRPTCVFEVLPLRRTQVGRKSWVLRPYLRPSISA
jgi:hypothetical protein